MNFEVCLPCTAPQSITSKFKVGTRICYQENQIIDGQQRMRSLEFNYLFVQEEVFVANFQLVYCRSTYIVSRLASRSSCSTDLQKRGKEHARTRTSIIFPTSTSKKSHLKRTRTEAHRNKLNSNSRMYSSTARVFCKQKQETQVTILPASVPGPSRIEANSSFSCSPLYSIHNVANVVAEFLGTYIILDRKAKCLRLYSSSVLTGRHSDILDALSCRSQLQLVGV